MLIDCHAHAIPEPVLEWLRARAERLDVRLEPAAPGRPPTLTVGGRWPFALKPAFGDREGLLAAQREAGLDATLLSPVPQLFLYEADPALTAEAARVYNEALLDWCARADGRLLALATVPLNAPERAADELSWAVARGMRGAIVGPGVDETPLSDPRFDAFWEAAEAREAVVFVHPLLSRDRRLARPQLPNLVGVPWETTVAAVDLIFGGVVDRYPRARVLLAHGGGYLPYQLGRLERGYDVWPAVRQQLQARPRDYLQRFWYDSVLWRPEALACLLEAVGPSRVVPGSDSPFDLSEWPPRHRDGAGAAGLLARAG